MGIVYPAPPAFPILTWATKPAAYPAGQVVFISDYGTRGTYWVYDTGMARWKPFGKQLLKSLDALSAATNNTETIRLQQLLPAAGLQAGDRIEARLSITKSGTTDTGSLRVRVGTAGTTGDAVVYSTTFLSAAQIHGGAIVEFRADSATTLQLLARSDYGYGGATTNGIPAPVTIPNISNALYVSASLLSGGATNTVIMADAQFWISGPSS
jgi:hypothetical protein